MVLFHLKSVHLFFRVRLLIRSPGAKSAKSVWKVGVLSTVKSTTIATVTNIETIKIGQEYFLKFADWPRNFSSITEPLTVLADTIH